MSGFARLNVSQKLSAICVADAAGRRVWHGHYATDPERVARAAQGHAADNASTGIETGPMTPWLVATAGPSGPLTKRSYNCAIARRRR